MSAAPHPGIIQPQPEVGQNTGSVRSERPPAETSAEAPAVAAGQATPSPQPQRRGIGPAAAPAAAGDATLAMPRRLGAVDLAAVRRNPLCATADPDELHTRIGWLICAYDAIVAARTPAPEDSPPTQNAYDIQAFLRKSERGRYIQASRQHDAGAYAQCHQCGRYSDNHQSLVSNNWPCDCGVVGHWSGSFRRPNAESRWSDATP